MSWEPTDHEFTVAARLHARLEIASAEIRTLEALSLPARARAIVNISRIDLECAGACLTVHPDSGELEHVGRWLEMVESQLHAVRRGLTAIGVPERPVSKIA